MDSKIKELLADKPIEETCRIIDKVCTVYMVLDIAFTIGIYALLRAWTSIALADTWLVIMYLVELKRGIDRLAFKWKNETIEDRHEKDKEDKHRLESKRDSELR